MCEIKLAICYYYEYNSQDMIELMKLTALQHKVANLDPLAISAEKVLELATIDGARAIGMEDEKAVLTKVQEIADNLCERGNITNRREGHKWNSLY